MLGTAFFDESDASSAPVDVTAKVHHRSHASVVAHVANNGSHHDEEIQRISPCTGQISLPDLGLDAFWWLNEAENYATKPHRVSVLVSRGSTHRILHIPLPSFATIVGLTVTRKPHAYSQEGFLVLAWLCRDLHLTHATIRIQSTVTLTVECNGPVRAALPSLATTRSKAVGFALFASARTAKADFSAVVTTEDGIDILDVSATALRVHRLLPANLSSALSTEDHVNADEDSYVEAAEGNAYTPKPAGDQRGGAKRGLLMGLLGSAIKAVTPAALATPERDSGRGNANAKYLSAAPAMRRDGAHVVLVASSPLVSGDDRLELVRAPSGHLVAPISLTNKLVSSAASSSDDFVVVAAPLTNYSLHSVAYVDSGRVFVVTFSHGEVVSHAGAPHGAGERWRQDAFVGLLAPETGAWLRCLRAPAAGSVPVSIAPLGSASSSDACVLWTSAAFAAPAVTSLYGMFLSSAQGSTRAAQFFTSSSEGSFGVVAGSAVLRGVFSTVSATTRHASLIAVAQRVDGSMEAIVLHAVDDGWHHASEARRVVCCTPYVRQPTESDADGDDADRFEEKDKDSLSAALDSSPVALVSLGSPEADSRDEYQAAFARWSRGVDAATRRRLVDAAIGRPDAFITSSVTADVAFRMVESGANPVGVSSTFVQDMLTNLAFQPLTLHGSAQASNSGDVDAPQRGAFLFFETHRWLVSFIKQEISARLIAVQVAHISWLCRGLENEDGDRRTVEAVLTRAYCALSVAYRLVELLKTSTAKVFSPSEPTNVNAILCSLLPTSEAILNSSHEDLTMHVVKLGETVASGLNNEIATRCRALSLIAQTWATVCPAALHYGTLALETRRVRTGVATSEIVSNVKGASAALVQCSLETCKMVVQAWTVSRRTDASTGRVVSIDDVADGGIDEATFRSFLVNLYHASVLKRSLSKGMPPLTDMETIRMLMNHGTAADTFLERYGADGAEGLRPTLAEIMVEALAQSVASFVDAGNIDAALAELSYLATIAQRSLSEAALVSVQQLCDAVVKAAFNQGQVSVVINFPFSSPALLSLVAGEIHRLVLRTVPVSTQAERKDRETKRVEYATALYALLSKKRAYGLASRVAYELSSALRSASQGTPNTMSHSLRMMSLAVAALQLTPSCPPLPADDAMVELADFPWATGGTSSSMFYSPSGVAAGTSLASPDTSSMRFASSFPSAGGMAREGTVLAARRDFSSLEPISRRHVRTLVRRRELLRCESILSEHVSVDRAPWPDDLDLDEADAGIEQTVTDLIRIRRWPDALLLVQAWDADPTVIFRSQLGDLLDHGGSPRDWKMFHDAVLRASVPENNHKYLKSCVEQMIRHPSAATSSAPPLLLEELVVRDPSSLVVLWLAAEDASLAVQTRTMEYTAVVLRAALQKQKQGDFLTPTAVDRAHNYAVSILSRYREGDGGAGLLLKLAKEVKELHCKYVT